jgi:hypothetical protein
MDAIPRGIEVLVKKASVDPAFKAMLMSVRSKAGAEIGLTLDPSEAALLDLVPAAQLSAIIAATRVDPSKKPAFLGKAAAVMLVALGASAVTSQAQKVAGLDSAPPATAQASQPTSRGALERLEEERIVVAGMTRTGPNSQPAATQPSQPVTASAPAVSADEVKKLLAQLDAEDFATREKAQKALMDLGLGSLPMLEDSLKDTKLSLEVQTRIQRVIRNLKATTQPVRPTDVRAVRGERMEEVAGAKADIP